MTGRPAATQIAAVGANACAAGQLDDCVMLLPIADAIPMINGCLCIHAITYGAFWINEIDANTHTGTLLWPYTIQAKGTLSWNPSQVPGLLIIRLTD